MWHAGAGRVIIAASQRQHTALLSEGRPGRDSPLSTQKRPLFARGPVLFLGALLSCALWGSAIPCIKLSYDLFGIDTGNPGALLLFAGLRFALAGALVLLAGCALERRPLLPGKGDWPSILKVSLFQTVLQYLCYYLALRHTSGVAASILVGANSFFAILIAALCFRMERLTAAKLAGCIVGFAGVVVSQLGSGAGGFSFTLQGEGLILLSALSAAVSATLIRRYSAQVSPVLLSGWQFLLGGAALALAGWAMGGRWAATSPAAVGMLIYLALVSAVAYTLWGCLLKHNPVSRVTIFGFLTPVFGVVLSALLLSEGGALGWSALGALVLVCAGILLVNRPAGSAAEQ